MPRLAQGAANAVAAMLAEQVPHAEIDLIDVIFGHIKEAADGLCRFVADFFFRWTQFFGSSKNLVEQHVSK